MAKIVCKVFGVIFVLIGLVVFVRGEQENQYHNLLHIATGAVAHYFGFAGSVSGAKQFCQGFGAFYLALGGLGVLLGDPAKDRLWQVGPLSLDMGDHGFHLVLGTIFLASGLFSKRIASSARVTALQ